MTAVTTGIAIGTVIAGAIVAVVMWALHQPADGAHHRVRPVPVLAAPHWPTLAGSWPRMDQMAEAVSAAAARRVSAAGGQ